MAHLFSNFGTDTKKIIYDDEFGEIQIKRTHGSTISLKPKTDGSLTAILPHFVSVKEITKLLDLNRDRLRESRVKINKGKTYHNGDLIGKSHTLRIIPEETDSIKLKGLDIIVKVRNNTPLAKRNQIVKDGVAKALRKEAKAYLPRRLSYLAVRSGFNYNSLRFMHAKSRWGSCSSNGTISLNIMLMTLPNDLIDYVLYHELTHTKHMNHSDQFWKTLEDICPGAKQKRRSIKQYSPYL